MPYILKLYISGESPRSAQAAEHLRALFDDRMGEQYVMEIIDIAKRPELAEQQKIIATPALVKESPEPVRQMVGDFTDSSLVMKWLGVDFESKPDHADPPTEETNFSRLVEMSIDGIVVIDESGKVQFANPAAEAIFGKTSEELLDNPFGLPLVAGENTEIEILRDNKERVTVEMRVRNFSWDGKGEFLASLRDITERKQAEERMEKSLKEKETLLQEIHHRVKNNLAVIGGILGLQIDRYDNPEIKQILKENIGRIFAIASIHEGLYESENLSEINIKSFLRQLFNTLAQTFSIDPGKVNFEVDSPDILLKIDTANPVGIILNELITNSLKFAFPGDRKGTLRIKLQQEADGIITLTVSDDGIGIPEDFSWTNQDTLGLRVVKDLVERQLDGTIDLDHSKGTEFLIRFRAL